METKRLEKIWVNRDIHVHVLRWLTEVHIFSWLRVERGFLWTTDQHWRLLVEARVFVAVAELGSAQLTQTHAHDVIVRAVEETVHSPEDPLVLVVEVVHDQTVADPVEPLEDLMGLQIYRIRVSILYFQVMLTRKYSRTKSTEYTYLNTIVIVKRCRSLQLYILKTKSCRKRRSFQNFQFKALKIGVSVIFLG